MINTIWKIVIREWKRVFRLPVHYWVLILMPPLLFCFYSYIYINPKLENLPIAVWDEDQSPVSRELTFLLEQTATIHITHQVNSLPELQSLIKRGAVLAAVHFPANMYHSLQTRHPATITLYTNGAALVPAKLIYKDAAQVIIMGGAGVTLQKFVKSGMNSPKAMALVQPIKLTAYTLYNADYNYQNYLAPGLITVGLQMLIIMVSVLLLNYELKTNTMVELLEISNNNAFAVIIGKTLAHIGIAWLNFILIVAVVLPLFEISVPGTTLKFFLLYNLLSLACIGIGMLVSSIFNDTMLATDIALFYTSPAFVFSGFTFPRWAMPWYDQYYSQIMPYTHFLDGFFKIYYMNLPLHYAFAEIFSLLLFIGLTFPLSIIFFRLKIKKIIANENQSMA
ncbi:ABC transporter permease [Solitalea sp. MAHUQ-68]|uniref:ABC transporter permease n=1 Tax=Solitalea agri TaxID=2953739 RepID=A0A9X2F2Y5_9SPHI|nr:ABC transporter permease [Solitalea agri]MCO4293250.1 ABC transporter permease [Solitalea agri]